MPIYTYRNPQNHSEIEEVHQGMNDAHVYCKDGVEWERVFTIPNAAVDSKTPQTKNDFMDVTSRKKGTVGDMQDLSTEMSQKRAEQSLDGKDPIKTRYFKEYSEKRRGRKHHMDKSPIKKNGITVTFDD